MKKYITYIILIFSFPFQLLGQSTYYISNQGSDNNDGQSTKTPWKTISKVNSVVLTPGDKVLFKSGDVWSKESLKVKHSGRANKPIIFSSYGSGERPIISLYSSFPSKWSDPNTWTELKDYPNVWQADMWNSSTLNRAIRRVWLDGTEYNYTPSLTQDNHDGTYGVSETHRHSTSHSVGKEFIWAPSNPANFYSSIQYSGFLDDIELYAHAITLQNVNYISLENLTLQGGLDCALRVIGSDYIVIDSCDIGEYSQAYGTRIDGGSDYGTIKNCNFDSGNRIVRKLETAIVGQIAEKAIGLENGASYWEIHDNYFYNWTIGVGTTAWTNYSNYHSIYHNEMTAPHLGYSKGVSTMGLSPYHKLNIDIYNNYIHDIQTYAIQVGGWNVKAYFNIIENVTQSQAMHNNYAYGGALIILKGDGNISPEYVYFFNNTIYKTMANAVRIFSNRNTIINNLFIDTGVEENNVEFRGYGIHNNSFLNSIFTGGNLTSITNSFVFGETSYSISDFNNADDGTSSTIEGNSVYEGTLSNLVNIGSYKLPTGSPAINNGIDISSLVFEGFKDRNGNLVDRKTPNIGAIDGNSNLVNIERNISKSNIKLVLEGPYLDGKMSSLLRNKIPNFQPYAASDLNYNGTENFSIAPAGLIDWVLIELRTKNNQVKYKFAALLLENGKIVTHNGSEDFSIYNIINGEYYLIIYHRNHLSIMSSQMISISNSQIVYDFSDSNSKARGNNSMKDLGDGTYGMYAGDSDGNGIINNLDFGNVANNIFLSNYSNGDLDMNGIINVLDYSKISSNIFKKSVVSKSFSH